MEPITIGGWYERDGRIAEYRWRDGQLVEVRAVASWDLVPEDLDGEQIERIAARIVAAHVQAGGLVRPGGEMGDEWSGWQGGAAADLRAAGVEPTPAAMERLQAEIEARLSDERFREQDVARWIASRPAEGRQ